jgi:predicted nucleic acid-binding protein
MILVDTSVWVDHFRTGVRTLSALLDGNRVLMHSLVLGEIACGNLRDRRQVLQLLSGLPAASRASDAEVMIFIESNQLMGQGIGFVDAHLLAAVVLEPETLLWTRDRSLAQAAESLGVACVPGE